MIRALSILLVCWMTAGCHQYRGPSDVERSETFSAFARVGDEFLSLFIERRTAVVVSCSVPIIESASDGQMAGLRFGPNGVINGPSHAVAIDRRGYFLTAAHCLDHPFVYLIFFDGKAARVAVPRVVAKFADISHHLDLAIVHVDAGIPYVFEWADAEALARRGKVVAVGCRDLAESPSQQALCSEMCMSGAILSVTAASRGATAISSHLPLRRGDSGGPLVAMDGRLLGVNCSVDLAWNGQATAVAVRPNLHWMSSVILNDVAVHHPYAGPRIAVLMNKSAAHFIVALW